jgi:hypothetical protein
MGWFRKKPTVQPSVEAFALARFEQPREVAVRDDRGGVSGMCGGRILLIGETGISPSLTAHVKNCCSARNLTDAVAGLHRVRMSPVNDSTGSRLKSATSPGIPYLERNAASWRTASP